MDPSARERRARRLLAAGAAGGLLLAALGLLSKGGGNATGALPADAVAALDGALIRRADYERVLAGLVSDSRNPVDEATRRRVLDRMIDEELLVQRALDLGLAQADRRGRADLTSSLIASVVADAEDEEPSDADLQQLYERDRDFFTRPARLHVRRIFFRLRADEEAGVKGGANGSGPAEPERVRKALARLRAGADFEAVRKQLGDEEISAVPDALLPPLKLREYIGPSALRAALALEAGGITRPLYSSGHFSLLKLVEREDSETPPLPEIEDLVRREWLRRSGDRALRRYLDALRKKADVVTRLEAAEQETPGA